MSQLPEYPGRQRLKRAAASAGSDAYQGAMEAVGSVLISCAFGYWVDSRWDTAPIGLLVGTIVGFAAMVLRLVRMGREIHSDPAGTEDLKAGTASQSEGSDELGVGQSPGLSSILREDDDDNADVQTEEKGRGEAE